MALLRLLRGDDFDLHQGVLGQRGHLYGGSGRAHAGEILPVDGVHGGKIPDVLEVHVGLDHVVHGQTGRLEDGPDVLQRLMGLAGDIRSGKSARGRVQRKLTGYEDKASGADRLGVGADGRGSGVGVEFFFHDDPSFAFEIRCLIK